MGHWKDSGYSFAPDNVGLPAVGRKIKPVGVVNPSWDLRTVRSDVCHLAGLMQVNCQNPREAGTNINMEKGFLGNISRTLENPPLHWGVCSFPTYLVSNCTINIINSWFITLTANNFWFKITSTKRSCDCVRLRITKSTTIILDSNWT